MIGKNTEVCYNFDDRDGKISLLGESRSGNLAFLGD